MKSTEKKQQRAARVAEARALLDKAEQEKRGLTAEEEQQYDRIMAEVDKMGKEIERLERLEEEERRLDQVPPNNPFRPDGGDPTPGPEDRSNPRATDAYRAGFQRFLHSGVQALTETEHRAMQADSAIGGGFLVAPQQFITQLLKAVDDQVVIRALSTPIRLERAASLGVPQVDSDLEDLEWTAELKTGSEDKGLMFGKRELRPHPVAKRVKISNTLLRVSAIDMESLVRDRLAYRLAATMEKHYMTGDGTAKPLGLFVASADGIPTSRDISTDNTATSVTADGLINAKYALKQAYWGRARWLFHRDVIKQIRKLKNTGDGQYVWQPGLAAGAPDRILDTPYIISEFAPKTLTTGQYAGIIGDFSYYWIVDALDFAVQRLSELYAETNQTGFIGRYEGDAQPVLPEAFIRVKLG